MKRFKHCILKLSEGSCKCIFMCFSTIVLLHGYFFSVEANAQSEIIVNAKKLRTGLDIGLNFSKFSNDTLKLKYGSRPFAGLDFTYRCYKNFGIKSNLLYSMRGSSSISPRIRFENSYIDLFLMPGWLMSDDFSFFIGGGYSRCIISYSAYLSETNNQNTIKVKNKNFADEISLAAGFTCRLSKRTSLICNYVYPVWNNSFRNIQLGLTINFYREKKSRLQLKEIKKENAANDIVALKNGVLLYRLKTSEHQINALLRNGKTEEADLVSELQKNENLNIIASFRKHFDFCKVMFFYSDHSAEVKNKSYKNIFLSDNLTIDSLLTIDTLSSVFIAEIGILGEDSVKLKLNNGNTTSENESPKTYSVPSTDMNLTALKIMNSDFNELTEPFPYFVRVLFRDFGEKNKIKSAIPRQLSVEMVDESVRILNENLWNYYNRINK